MSPFCFWQSLMNLPAFDNRSPYGRLRGMAVGHERHYAQAGHGWLGNWLGRKGAVRLLLRC